MVRRTKHASIMKPESARAAPISTDPFVRLIGSARWRCRLEEILDLTAAGPRAAQAIRQRHAVELTIEKLRHRPDRPRSVTEALLAQVAHEIPVVAARLTPSGRDRMVERLQHCLTGDNTLIPMFHLVRTALLQQSRGFTVSYTGLEHETPHDLVLKRDAIEADVACDVVTAEAGRGVHRGAWFRLADRVDPDLQTWLAAHPGRYLLKMTLPQGLRGGLHDSSPDSDTLAHLHHRITAMLAAQTRQDCDEAIVLRLDPLLLAGAQAEEMGLVSSLRREFGPEAHLSVTTAGDGVFVMAARAGHENEVALALRRRLAAIAPLRLTGERPGILAMFVEDTDRLEWRGLRERLELEGEARQFLTDKAARPVVAVTFASRLELFGIGQPDAAPEGEIRFRNPGHPAAGLAALAPAVMSSV
jgi:hypothetical protein